MGAKLRVENGTQKNLLLQVELTGMAKTIPPSGKVLVDTDFDKGEEVYLEVRPDHIIVWAGVAAQFLGEDDADL